MGRINIQILGIEESKITIPFFFLNFFTHVRFDWTAVGETAEF